jgi:hypothetical protein
MLKHLAKIAAIDPATAGRAPNEVRGFLLRRIGEALPDVVAAGDHRDQSSSASRLTAGPSGFLNLSQSGERPDR